jgi:hypothetical protein
LRSPPTRARRPWIPAQQRPGVLMLCISGDDGGRLHACASIWGTDADQERQPHQQQGLHRCHFLDISRIPEQGKAGGQRETPPDGCGSDACGKLRPPKKAPKHNATVHGKPPLLAGDETRTLQASRYLSNADRAVNIFLRNSRGRRGAWPCADRLSLPSSLTSQVFRSGP